MPGASERSTLHALGDNLARSLSSRARRARWIAVLLSLCAALSGTARAGGAAGGSVTAGSADARPVWTYSVRENVTKPPPKSAVSLTCGRSFYYSFSRRRGKALFRLFIKAEGKPEYTCHEVRSTRPLAAADSATLQRAEQSFWRAALIMRGSHVQPLPAECVAKHAANGIIESRPADPASMFTAAIKGMVKGLNDPWTHYFPGGEQEFKSAIGPKHTVIFERAAPDKVKRVSRRSGLLGLLRPGDRVLDVDGLRDPAAISACFDDYEARTQRITVKREGHEVVLDVAGRAAPRHVWGELSRDGIAILRIYDLLEGTYAELKETWHMLRQRASDKGVALRAVLFDLRGNPGGGIEETEKVVSYLFGWQQRDQQLWPCHIVLYKKQGKKLHREACTRPIAQGASSAHRLPWAVLTDSGTGSSAEMFARLVQLRERGPVIGETTVGKDKATCFTELADGSGLLYSQSFFGYLRRPANNRSEREKIGIIAACAVQPDVPAADAKEAIEQAMKDAKVVDPLLQYGLQLLRGRFAEQ